MDKITFLFPTTTPQGPRSMQKRLAKEGAGWKTAQGYPLVKTFVPLEKAVGGLGDLGRALAWGSQAHVLNLGLPCVVRGVPEEAGAGRVFRKLAKNRKEGELSCLNGEAHHWFCLDLDKKPAVSGVDLSTSEDCRKVGEAFRALLPEPFSQAECVFSLSSSCGVKATWGCHLWFWAQKPLETADLKAWFKANTPKGLVDLALFSEAQVHYIAPPAFEGGTDPIALRIGLMAGKPLAMPAEAWGFAAKRKEEERKRFQRFGGKRSQGEIHEELETDQAIPAKSLANAAPLVLAAKAHLLSSLEEAEEGERHALLFKAACDLEGFKKAGLLDGYEGELANAALACGKERGEIEAAIEYARTHAKRKIPLGTKRLFGKEDQKPFVQEKKYLSIDIERLAERKERTLLCLHASLGTGKTEVLRRILDRMGRSSVAAFSPLISLTKDLARRLSLPCYLDLEGKIRRSCAVTVNSLSRLQGEDAPFDPSIVFLDEIESIRKAMTNAHFQAQMRTERKDLYDAFARMLGEARLVVACDAFLSEETALWLSSLVGRPAEMVTHVSTDRRCWIDCRTEAELVTRAEALVLGGKNVVIATNSIGKAKALGKRFSPYVKEDELLVYHSEITKDVRATLENVNETWAKARVVIYSPAVSSGVSFDVPDHFEAVFSVWSHHVEGLSADDFFQQVLRVRRPKTNAVFYYVASSFHVPKSKEELRDEAEAVIGSIPKAIQKRTIAQEMMADFRRSLPHFYTYEPQESMLARLGVFFEEMAKQLPDDPYFAFLLDTNALQEERGRCVADDIAAVAASWGDDVRLADETLSQDDEAQFRDTMKKLKEEIKEAEIANLYALDEVPIIEAIVRAGEDEEDALRRAVREGDTDAKDVIRRRDMMALAPARLAPFIPGSEGHKEQFVFVAKNEEIYRRHRLIVKAIEDSDEQKGDPALTTSILHRAIVRGIEKEKKSAVLLDPKNRQLVKQDILADLFRLPAFVELFGDMADLENEGARRIDVDDPDTLDRANAIGAFLLAQKALLRGVGLDLQTALWENQVPKALGNLARWLGFDVARRRIKRGGVKRTVFDVSYVSFLERSRDITEEEKPAPAPAPSPAPAHPPALVFTAEGSIFPSAASLVGKVEELCQALLFPKPRPLPY